MRGVEWSRLHGPHAACGPFPMTGPSVSPIRLLAVLLLVLAWFVGCDAAPPAGPSAPGAMRLVVSLPLAAPNEVTRVTVTGSGPDMEARSADLSLSNGAWGGVLGDLPGQTAELHDPVTGRWSTPSAPSRPRHSHTATFLPNGKVLVVGGKGAYPDFYATAEV